LWRDSEPTLALGRENNGRRIRRAAGYAQVQVAKFLVVSVRTRSQSAEEKEWMGGYAALTHQLGSEFYTS
jgi:K+-sensing histidine kinase KdpD